MNPAVRGAAGSVLIASALLLPAGRSHGPAAASGAPTRAAQARPAKALAAPEKLVTQVLAVWPHDPEAFTEGLLLHDGWLYESTGRDGGEARIRQVDLHTGVAAREAYLPPVPGGGTYFGEGLALVGDHLIQLTWLHGVAFEFLLPTFEEVGRLQYAGEGWGLSFNGAELVMSNGTDTLAFRDPVTFAMLRQLRVTEDGLPVSRLNELECVGDSVYANVFLTDDIVRIDPSTGAVTARIDASGLLSPAERASADVLNGIAYDPAARTFLVTGKWWPKLFEVVFRPARLQPSTRAYLPVLAARAR